MLDVVKFTWRNRHGYWIPVAWVVVLTGADPGSRVRLGRPGLTDFKVLDRMTIPEELRLTGRSSWALAMVVLYDKQADDYTAAEFVDAMAVQAS